MQFPQNDLIDLCENSSSSLGTFTRDSNKCHSEPAAENESHDEIQGAVDMICKHFRQQGAPEDEVDKVSGDPLEYQYFSTMFKQIIERQTKRQIGRLTRFIVDETKD